MQNYARKMKCPIDKLDIRYDLTPFQDVSQVINLPFDGCYIHGLFSEGFRFEVDHKGKYTLETPLPGELYAPCNLIHFAP